MKLLAVAAALAFVLAGCVLKHPPVASASTQAPPAAPQRYARVGFIGAEPDQVMTAEQSAAWLRAAEATMADPPRDEAHPARNRQLVIPSGPVVPALGRPAEMNALFFAAAGAGPHPTMLLLHGLPGNERNLDLAQAVRRAGWNVLTFTYRGAWGSEGTFSIEHAVADTEAALAWLRSEAAARDYEVDQRRIVIAGHSMGGYMAAHVADRDGIDPDGAVNRQPSYPRLAGVILLDAWDIGEDARQLQAAGAQGRAAFMAGMDDVGHALGPITAADLYDELMRRGTQWDLAALAPALARMPVLTVYATHGGAESNRALAAAIEEANECGFNPLPDCSRVTAVELNTDHAFADKRVALAREVVGWLEGLVGR